MLDNFIYENHLGQRFYGLESGVYLNIGELRDYTWTHETINNRISRFYRKTTNRKIPLYVVGETYEQAAEAMNLLLDITEADIAENIPGSVFIGDYYTRGFITTSKKTKYLDNRQLCKLDLTLTSDDPSWYKNTTHYFYTDATIPKNKKSGNVVVLNGAPNSPLRGFTVYGKTTQDGTPTPDAPIDMIGTGMDSPMRIVTAGKNLAALTPKVPSYAGITSSYDEQSGTITVTGTATGVSYVSYWLREFIPAGTPLLIGFCNQTTDKNITVYAFSQSEDKMTQFASLNLEHVTVQKTFDHAFEFIGIRVADGATVNMTLKIGIMVGNNVSDYAWSLPVNPSGANIIIANYHFSLGGLLHGLPVTEGGNYTDENGQQWISDTIEYDADTGTAQIVRRVDSVMYFGSDDENWEVSQDGTFLWILQKNKSNAALGLCTHYPANAIALGGKNVGFSAGSSGTAMRFRPADYATITLDAWRARLEESPVTVLYALSTPEIEKISDNEISALRTLKIFNPDTTIINDANAYMDVVYSTVSNSSGSSFWGIDYSFDHPYEYAVKIKGRSIVCDAFSSSAFRLLIYGECINPTVNIGGHAYTVNGSVGNGETLLIDSDAKTITLTTAYGNTVNYFDKRSRDSYIFEPIPAGENSVTWSGDFGFELTVIEKRSEPKWT